MKRLLVHIGTLACGLLPAVLCLVSTARADSFSVALNYYFGTNSINPGTPAPWTTLTFSDVSPGTVMLAISNSPSLSSKAKLSDIYLNFNPSLNLGSLTLSLSASSSGLARPTFSAGEDEFMVSSDGRFDLDLAFSTSGRSGSSFGAGEYAVFDLTGPSGLDAADFEFLSSGGSSTESEAAGHLLGLGNGQQSAWIGPSDIVVVPEPGVAALFGLGVGMLALYRRGQRSALSLPIFVQSRFRERGSSGKTR